MLFKFYKTVRQHIELKRCYKDKKLLIKHLAQGIDDAIIYLSLKEYEKCESLAHKFGQDRDTADFLFTNALLFVMEKAKSGNLKAINPEVYLYNAFKNRLKDYCDKIHRRAGIEKEVINHIAIDLEENLLSKEKHKALHEIIDQMDETSAVILKSYYFEGMSYEELLLLLKGQYKSVNSLRNKVSKCKAKLIKAIMQNDVFLI